MNCAQLTGFLVALAWIVIAAALHFEAMTAPGEHLCAGRGATMHATAVEKIAPQPNQSRNTAHRLLPPQSAFY